MPLWWNNFWSQDHVWLEKWIASAAVVGAVLLLRWLLRRVIQRSEIKSADLRRRWIVGLRNLMVALMLFGLLVVWAEQLRTLAVSLVAFLAVIVISLKELILCFTGSALKLGARAFTVGDRVSIGAFRGDVIDQTLLTTTLLEVGARRISASTHRPQGHAAQRDVPEHARGQRGNRR